MIEFELTDELASLFEALHDSEINGEIGWFYDRVWRAEIGDPWMLRPSCCACSTIVHGGVY